MYEGFRKYQTSLLEQFDRLADEYNFKVVDATPEPRKIFEKLRSGITKILEGEHARPTLEIAPSNAPPPTPISGPSSTAPEEPVQQDKSSAVGASSSQGESLKI
jgi:hypothetical protein